MAKTETKAEYVAVLKRAIPVDGIGVDTMTHIVRDGETVADVMEWVENACKGSTVLISVEIVEAN